MRVGWVGLKVFEECGLKLKDFWGWVEVLQEGVFDLFGMGYIGIEVGMGYIGLEVGMGYMFLGWDICFWDGIYVFGMGYIGNEVGMGYMFLGWDI